MSSSNIFFSTCPIDHLVSYVILAGQWHFDPFVRTIKIISFRNLTVDKWSSSCSTEKIFPSKILKLLRSYLIGLSQSVVHGLKTNIHDTILFSCFSIIITLYLCSFIRKVHLKSLHTFKKLHSKCSLKASVSAPHVKHS